MLAYPRKRIHAWLRYEWYAGMVIADMLIPFLEMVWLYLAPAVSLHLQQPLTVPEDLGRVGALGAQGQGACLASDGVPSRGIGATLRSITGLHAGVVGEVLPADWPGPAITD